MIRKGFLLALLVCLSTSAFSKKVKFAVDMTGQTLLSTGVHVTGDFQTAAGFAGGDWMSNTTALTKEVVDTNIWSIVVDIPAFAKYEYKFINGDQFYEAEFVPVESRVGYLFDDNRWIYVDSTANDTSFVGAILFGGNAPKGYRLLRLLVDLQNEVTIDPAKTHVAGSFNSWSATKNIMYKLNDTIDELIVYIDTLVANAQFKFINGNSAAGYETVPGACATAGNRNFVVPKDSVLALVCFSSCAACIPAGINEETFKENSLLYPNPTAGSTTLEFESTSSRTILISDVLGKTVRTYVDFTEKSLEIKKDELISGIYFVKTHSKENKVSTAKLIIQ